MKVLLFLPKAFEHMESSVFIDVLGWARHCLPADVQLVAAGFSRKVISTFGVAVCVDILIDEVDAASYDALAIPGGFSECGYLEEAHHEKLLTLIRAFDRQRKPIAAVCMAGIALGKSGILSRRRATTYFLHGSLWLDRLRDYGAVAVAERIVIDDNVITSCGPETAVWVAFALLQKLTSIAETEKVKSLMGYPCEIQSSKQGA